MEADALVTTTLPRRYLGQLCKHFQHRLPVRLDEAEGRIEFPMGVCTLKALPDGLQMHVGSGHESALSVRLDRRTQRELRCHRGLVGLVELLLVDSCH